MADWSGTARGGLADEYAPKGVPPQSPPARAGDRASAARGAGSTRDDASERVDTLGVVLAGGLSRRMGEVGPKAAMLIGGEPLLARVVRRLRAAGLPAVLVVGAPDRLSPLVPGVPVVADRRQSPDGAHGPLAGLETALMWASAAHDPAGGPLYRCAFVVACDMPFVSPALVRAMLQRAAQTLPTTAAEAEAAALILRTADGTQQLHAVYTLGCLPVATALLDAGARSLRDLLARVRTAEFPASDATPYDPAGLSAFNANTPDDWQRALALAVAETG